MELTIKVGDKELPIVRTLGAFLRFKELSGKDISQAKDDISDATTLLYVCAESGCRKQGIEFKYSLLEFADNVEIGEMQRVQELFKTDDSQKKATVKKPQQ